MKSLIWILHEASRGKENVNGKDCNDLTLTLESMNKNEPQCWWTAYLRSLKPMKMYVHGGCEKGYEPLDIELAEG